MYGRSVGPSTVGGVLGRDGLGPSEFCRVWFRVVAGELWELVSSVHSASSSWSSSWPSLPTENLAFLGLPLSARVAREVESNFTALPKSAVEPLRFRESSEEFFFTEAFDFVRGRAPVELLRLKFWCGRGLVDSVCALLRD